MHLLRGRVQACRGDGRTISQSHWSPSMMGLSRHFALWAISGALKPFKHLFSVCVTVCVHSGAQSGCGVRGQLA